MLNIDTIAQLYAEVALEDNISLKDVTAIARSLTEKDRDDFVQRVFDYYHYITAMNLCK